MKNLNYFGLLSYGYWPILVRAGVMNFFLGFLILFKFSNLTPIFLGRLILISGSIIWFYEFGSEIFKKGLFSSTFFDSIKTGIVGFIISEVMLFFSFFWAYFDFFLSPEIELGGSYPPYLVFRFTYYLMPLLNTMVLILSRATITYSHHLASEGKSGPSFLMLLCTLLLGAFFRFLQFLEYSSSFFSIRDSSFGSLFFILTGLHGSHVLLGCLIILNCFSEGPHLLSSKCPVSVELCSWYWHFVDLVWLYVFFFIYYLNG